MYINLKKLKNFIGIKDAEYPEYGNVGKEKSMLGNKCFVIRE
jgi:hypothetical protein